MPEEKIRLLHDFKGLGKKGDVVTVSAKDAKTLSIAKPAFSTQPFAEKFVEDAAGAPAAPAAVAPPPTPKTDDGYERRDMRAKDPTPKTRRAPRAKPAPADELA